jgi:hypothetical protein
LQSTEWRKFSNYKYSTPLIENKIHQERARQTYKRKQEELEAKINQSKKAWKFKPGQLVKVQTPSRIRKENKSIQQYALVASIILP